MIEVDTGLFTVAVFQDVAWAQKGLEALKRPCRVRLQTDSIYVRDGITRWIKREGGHRSAEPNDSNKDNEENSVAVFCHSSWPPRNPTILNPLKVKKIGGIQKIRRANLLTLPERRKVLRQINPDKQGLSREQNKYQGTKFTRAITTFKPCLSERSEGAERLREVEESRCGLRYHAASGNSHQNAYCSDME